MFVWILFTIAIALIIHFSLERYFAPREWEDPQTHTQLILIFFILLFFGVILLLFSGRMQFLIVLLGALYPVFNRLKNTISYLMWMKQMQNEFKARPNSAAMSEEEALSVLGLQRGCSKKEIDQAYKKMMLKCHPDQGGSEEMAVKINQARDVLLK